MLQVVLAFQLVLPAAAEPGVKDARKAAAAVAKELSKALEEKTGKVGVLGVTPIEDGTATTTFGQLLQETLTAELAARKGKKGKYEVVERREVYKLMEDSRLYGKDEDLFDRLRQTNGLDYMVSGSYAATDKEVSIAATVLDAKTGEVIASGRASMGNSKTLAAMQAVPKARTEPPAEPVSLEAALVYLGADNRLRAAREGVVLTSKDHYALYLKPASLAWVYIYQVDATGAATRLFPNEDFKTASNPLEPGREYWAPNGSDFYFLDEFTGKETIYLIASRKPKPALEDLVALKGTELAKKVEDLKLMGVGGRRTVDVVKVPPIKGNSGEILTRHLGASGDFLYTLSFEHR